MRPAAGRVDAAGDADALAVPDWEEYVGLLRRLEGDRAAGASGSAAVRTATARLSEQADVLEDRLVVQSGRLDRLGQALRRPVVLPQADTGPSSPPAPAAGDGEDSGPGGTWSAPRLLHQAALAIDEADEAAARAELRGAAASLLPRWPERARRLLVWCVAAVAVAVVQVGIFALVAEPNPLAVLVAVPLAGVLAGATILHLGSRPRLLSARGERPQLSLRMGLLLCLGIAPLAVAALMVGSLVSR